MEPTRVSVCVYVCGARVHETFTGGSPQNRKSWSSLFYILHAEAPTKACCDKHEGAGLEGMEAATRSSDYWKLHGSLGGLLRLLGTTLFTGENLGYSVT